MTEDQQKKLAEWEQALSAVAQVKPIIEKERQLRKEIGELFFPEPKEGTNTFDLEQGWKLKYVHKLDRKIDEAALPAVKEQLRTLGVNPDSLTNTVVTLDTKAYRGLVSLNPEAAKFFESALTIKPASPILELLPPSTTKEAE